MLSETQGIKPGDVVRLRSGGVPMTVESIDDDIAECAWFADTTLCRTEIPVRSLERVKEPPC